MAAFGEFKPALSEIARYLRILALRPCVDLSTSAGVGTNVPAGFRHVFIVKTSANTDTVTVTLSDGTTYPLTEKGEVLFDKYTENGAKLPAYTIVGPGTWKWRGVK